MVGQTDMFNQASLYEAFRRAEIRVIICRPIFLCAWLYDNTIINIVLPHLARRRGGGSGMINSTLNKAPVTVTICGIIVKS